MPSIAEDLEIEARLRLALVRIDRSLSEEEIEQVRGKTRHLADLARALRRTRLQNGDEPAPPFDPALGSATAAPAREARDHMMHASPGADGSEGHHDNH